MLPAAFMHTAAQEPDSCGDILYGIGKTALTASR